MGCRARRIVIWLAVLIVGALAPAAAQATPWVPVESGALSIAGEPNDGITFNGVGYSYTIPGEAAQLQVSPSPGDIVIWLPDAGWTIRYRTAGGAALSTGDYLTSGWLGDATHGGLEVSGNGHTCSESDGQVKVLAADFTQDGYLMKFQASFTLQCTGATGTVSGEVTVVRPLEPATPLATLAVSTTRLYAWVALGGLPEIRGTFACQPEAYGRLSVTVSQSLPGGSPVAATFEEWDDGPCLSGAPWVVQPALKQTFAPGPATVHATLILTSGFTTTLERAVTFLRYPGRARYAGALAPKPVNLRLTKRGRLPIKLVCPLRDGACSGRLMMTTRHGGKTVTAGQRSYSIARGTTATLQLALTRAARAAILRRNCAGTLTITKNGYGYTANSVHRFVLTAR